MYGKLVRIGGRDIWISCNPNTPLSEILMRASEQVRREEDPEREAKPTCQSVLAHGLSLTSA